MEGFVREDQIKAYVEGLPQFVNIETEMG